MGLDMNYQAIRHDFRLIEEMFGKKIDEKYFRLHSFSEDLEKNETTLVRSENSLAENREFDLGRRWDMLHYLLSENRRKSNQELDENDLMYQAIQGTADLGENIRLVQGCPVRYSNPQKVKEISRHLGQFSADDLEKFWNPKKMRACGVYKIRGDYTDDDQLYFLKEEFEQFKKFYLWAAIFDEGVLVFCD